MIYCVEINTTKVINSAEEKVNEKILINDVFVDSEVDKTLELKEVFIKNAESSGYSINQIEFISEDIYQERKKNIQEPKIISELDKIRADVDYLLMINGGL